jgi:hypothetical protein
VLSVVATVAVAVCSSWVFDCTITCSVRPPTSSAARMSEDDDEIRSEALIGLARRHHPDTLVLVRTELNRPFAGDWPIEAGELLADASLYPALQAVHESLPPEDKTHFERRFVAALAACRPKDEQVEN